MKTIRTDKRLILPVMVLVLLNSPATLSQTSVLEEIIVTAQKREQQMDDVGISVTAFSGDQMRELGLTSSTDLDTQTPGLNVTGYANSITLFNVRGAGQLDFNDNQEAPVAVYVDGAYVSWLAGVGFNFFDLERVEVLRGSQGTLFGRNATAGLVHVISKKPTDVPEGYLELTGGDYGMFRGEGAVSGPLTDSLTGRLSLYYEVNDGYVENLGTINDDHYDKDNVSGRAQLLFKPNEDLSVHLSGRWSIDDANTEAFHISPVYINPEGLFEDPPDAQTYFDFCTATFPAATPVLGASNCFGYSDDDPFSVNNDADTYFEREHYGVTATIDYDIGPGTLTSVTDWQDLSKRYSGDSDTSPQNLFHFFQDMDGSQISQELRFAMEGERTRWLAGLYYLNIETEGRAGVDAIGALGVGIDNLYELETTTYAAFGQFEYDFSSNFTGIIGIRWTEDDKKYSFTPRCTFLPGLQGLDTANCIIFAPLVQGSQLPSLKLDEGDWSGHIELDWRPNEDSLVYGKVSRGHKAGGVNGGIVSFFLEDELSFGAETPLTFELGLKQTFADGRARLHISGFYTDYKDFQAFTQRPGIGLLVFNNDAEVLGSEIELALNPWDGWDFLFGLSLLDAESVDLLGVDGVERDREMAHAPDLTFNALGRYEWPAFTGMMAVQVDMNYISDHKGDAENHPALGISSYDLWNAHVQWRSPSEKLTLRLWIKNLADKEFFPMAFTHATITGMTQQIVGEPRWFGGTVGYSW